MRITQEELSKAINNYIDDNYAFGDDEPKMTENVLKSLNMLNETEKGMDKKRLQELAENSSGESKYILKDFILYLESI